MSQEFDESINMNLSFLGAGIKIQKPQNLNPLGFEPTTLLCYQKLAILMTLMKWSE